MSEESWIDEVDSSALERVLPLGTVATRDDIAVEFIAVEIRRAGGVVTLRVTDESADEVTHPAEDFSVPVIKVRFSNGQELHAVVVAGDFIGGRSVRHRADFRPAPPKGISVQVSVVGFEMGRLQDSRGPWESGFTDPY